MTTEQNQQHMEPIDPNRFYTSYEVADRWGLHRNTIIKLVQRRELPATIIGKKYKFLGSDLLSYIEKNTIKTNNLEVS